MEEGESLGGPEVDDADDRRRLACKEKERVKTKVKGKRGSDGRSKWVRSGHEHPRSVALAIRHDLREAITEFISKGSMHYSSFRAIWKRRRLSLLHHSIPLRCDEDRVLQLAFKIVLDMVQGKEEEEMVWAGDHGEYRDDEPTVSPLMGGWGGRAEQYALESATSQTTGEDNRKHIARARDKNNGSGPSALLSRGYGQEGGVNNVPAQEFAPVSSHRPAEGWRDPAPEENGLDPEEGFALPRLEPPTDEGLRSSQWPPQQQQQQQQQQHPTETAPPAAESWAPAARTTIVAKDPCSAEAPMSLAKRAAATKAAKLAKQEAEERAAVEAEMRRASLREAGRTIPPHNVGPTSLPYTIGALFALYTLHGTQLPDPQHPIRVDPPTMANLICLRQTLRAAQSRHVADATAVLSCLVLTKSLVPAAFAGPSALPYIDRRAEGSGGSGGGGFGSLGG
ncbi:unnamed protein product, partial [Discosporangium mesarthrocarpum]